MRHTTLAGLLAALTAAVGASELTGCTGQAPSPAARGATAQLKSSGPVKSASASERECLIRAMYFESNRSSRDGLMAVGTVVMNRVASPNYPKTICGVVSQPGQFAAGALTRPLNARELPPVERAANAVLRGERYAPVGNAMHFHVAGLSIPYRVHYVTVAGGNAFYLKPVRSAVAAKSRSEIAIASSATQATLASASQPSLMDRLYASVASAPSTSPAGCQAASSAFGGTPLTCDEEAAAH
jgi:spore germination cell wall hydrolase CwlJ-like protein